MDLISLDTATRPSRATPRRSVEAKPAPRAKEAMQPMASPAPAAIPDGHEHPLATAHF